LILSWRSGNEFERNMMQIHKLPFKINATIIITAAAITGIFAAFFYPFEQRRHQSQTKRIQFLLDTVYLQKRNDLANELFARQDRALRASLEEMLSVEGIVAAAIFLPDGKPFLSVGLPIDPVIRESPDAPLPESASFREVRHGNHAFGRYMNAITVIGQKIGYIAIFYDFVQLEQDARRFLDSFIFLVAATVLIMSALLNVLLFRLVIRPVSLLRNAMREVENGRLGHVVALPGKDEISEMGAAFNDMSVRLKAGREALIRTEEKYRGIFENAIEGIFQSTPGPGRYLTVNPSMAALLGYASRDDLLASVTDIACQVFVRKTDGSALDAILQNQGRVIGFETELTRRDGTPIWVAISARRVASEDDPKAHYDEGSLIDITERRERERAEREREAAQAASLAKSEFLANMSHEIRTPMNAILGFAEILESGITDPQKRRYVQTIKSSGTSLLQLINDILDLSKIEAGRMEIQREPLNLRSLLEELSGIFSISLAQKGIALFIDVDPAVPEHLMADAVRIRQVLFNLIGNAVKFTEAGSVRCTAAAARSPDGEVWDLTLSVADTGIGIDPRIHEAIFTSFHQEPGLPGRRMEGTGLGLTISRKLVEMMGGRIRVESQKCAGSVFTVFLPRLAAASAPADKSGKGPATGDAGTLIFEPARLLLADDLEMNRALILAAMHPSPLTILEADNGRQAVEMALADPPDLVLMDIRMPELNGYEAIREMRRHPSLRDVPVIAITAGGMKEDVVRIREAGFDDFLIRPFSKGELHRAMARFLKQAKPQENAPERPVRKGGAIPVPELASHWTCPDSVARWLSEPMKARWEAVRRRQRIPDIRSFAHEIYDMGNNNDLPALSMYGQRMSQSADAFDITAIREALEDYPRLLARMRPAP